MLNMSLNLSSTLWYYYYTQLTDVDPEKLTQGQTVYK